MNYVKLFMIERPYHPVRCEGVEIALGIGALAAGVAGAAISSSSQERTNSQQINFSKSENDINREFNASEAEKQRQWEHDEWLNQYEKQTSDWYKQLAAQEDSQKRLFDYEAEYNKPINQVRRMQSAGLNPAAVLGGQGSSGMVAASSGNYASINTSVPSGGQVSGSAASAPSSLQPNLRAPIFDIGSLGSFLADFSRAYKDNATLRPELDLMAGQLSYLMSQQAGQELTNAYNAMNNYIKAHTKDYEIMQSFLDLGVTYTEMSLKGALAEEASANALLAKEERMLKRMQKKLTKEQYLQALFYTQHLNETFAMEMKVKSSEANRNNSMSQYFNELGITEKELRPWRVENIQLINDWQETQDHIAKNDAFVSDETIKTQVKLMTKSLENANLLNKELQERIKILEKEGKYFEIRTILNPIVNTAMSSMTNAVNSASYFIPSSTASAPMSKYTVKGFK